MAVLAFGPFRLDTADRSLRRGDTVVPLAPKVFDALALLVEARGILVEHRAFHARLWPNTSVEPRNLTVHISTLRRALSPDGSEEFIETVPRVGYRLLVPVTEVDAAPAIPAERRASEPARFINEIPTRRWSPLAMAVLVLASLATAGFVMQRSLGPRTSGASIEGAPTRIAVLPVLVTGGVDPEAFGVGLADAVIARLDLTPTFLVSRAREVLALGRQDPVEVGRALSASYVIEAVVERAEGTARTRVRILDVTSGGPLWAYEFAQRLSDRYQLQDVLAAHIAGAALRLVSIEQAAARYPRYAAASDEARKAYLTARMTLMQVSGPTRPSEALDAVRRAATVNPDFAPAWSMLARVLRLTWFSSSRQDEHLAAAYQAAERAQQIDPLWGETYTVLGILKYDAWQWGEAETLMRKAVELTPTADAYTWLANLYRGQGRWEESERAYRRALADDPTSSTATQQLGELFWHQGRYDEALGAMVEAARLQPSNSGPHQIRADIYDTLNMAAEAVEARRAANEISGNSTYLETVWPHAGKGYSALLQAELEYRQNDREWFRAATLLVQLGRHDEALRALEACVGERQNLSVVIPTDPRFAPLRDDERFRAIVRRVYPQDVPPSGS